MSETTKPRWFGPTSFLCVVYRKASSAEKLIGGGHFARSKRGAACSLLVVLVAHLVVGLGVPSFY